MKSKTIIIIMILTITGCLWAENGWSLPKQLSNLQSNMSPHMAIGSDGIIHTIWEAIEELGEGYGYIVYSKSEDDGITWTEPLKISSNTTHRTYRNTITLDINNNPHVAYTLSRGGDLVGIYYTTFDGVGWQEPEEVDHYVMNFPVIAVDNDRRVYLFWNMMGCSYFTYLENGEWTEVEKMEYEGSNYGVKAVRVDSQNNLLIAGYRSNATSGSERACYMIYNKGMEQWTKFEKIIKDDERSHARDIFVTLDNRKHVAMYYGDNYLENETNYAFYDSYWHEREFVSGYNEMYKRIVVDKNSDIHIFEIHEEETSEEYLTYLTHSYTTNSGWQTEKVHYWNDVTNQEFDVCIYNNKLYLVFDRFYYSSVLKIYFSTKEIELNIEDGSEIIEKGFKLSNYPNPFNPVTTINYQLNKADNVNLVVFNATGKQVWQSGERKQGAGKYTVKFDGSKLNTGIYFYTLEVNGIIKEQKKMVMIK